MALLGIKADLLSHLIRLFLMLILLGCMVAGHAQERKKIEILGADALKFGEYNGQKMRKLIGNVKLKQDSIYMDCDSAYFYTERNAVDAFGNVFIRQGDSLDIYADSLKYSGDDKYARLYNNVLLIEPRIRLTTDLLYYKLDTKVASYYEGGHVVGTDMDLVSQRGYYNSETRMAFFRDSVFVKGSDYTLKADTLGYNIDTEVSYFYGPTDITSAGNVVYCENGWYNTVNKKSLFGANTILYNAPQTLYADSLYYSQNEGIGEVYVDFVWVDTTMDIVLSGRRASFRELEQFIVATDSAMLTYILDGDSLFLSADTLISSQDTVMEGDTVGYRFFQAYYDVRIFKSDLQGLCDSLYYSYKDSVIRMYRDPVLWSEENQMTGDTILLALKNSELHSLELFQQGFIISKSTENLFDQIKGRHIYGYFVEGELNRMHAVGNGETVYFGKDTERPGAYVGVNKAVCSEMWIYVRDGDVSRINFIDSPEATFYPIQQIDPNNMLLDNFEWLQSQRPNSKADLFKPGEKMKKGKMTERKGVKLGG